MHDPRNLGYKRLKALDPVEDNLRSEWYAAKDRWVEEGSPSQGPFHRAFIQRDQVLSAYLWNRAKTDVEKDRAKHPRAKRNTPVPPRDPDASHPSRIVP